MADPNKRQVSAADDEEMVIMELARVLTQLSVFTLNVEAPLLLSEMDLLKKHIIARMKIYTKKYEAP